MSYYIKDTIVNEVLKFDDPNDVVVHLEYLCLKKFRKSRKDFMFEMESLGHGYDDPKGINFTNLMSDHFEVGAIKSDGRLTRTNIHELSRNLKYRNEMGD